MINTTEIIDQIRKQLSNFEFGEFFDDELDDFLLQIRGTVIDGQFDRRFIEWQRDTERHIVEELSYLLWMSEVQLLGTDIYQKRLHAFHSKVRRQRPKIRLNRSDISSRILNRLVKSELLFRVSRMPGWYELGVPIQVLGIALNRAFFPDRLDLIQNDGGLDRQALDILPNRAAYMDTTQTLIRKDHKITTFVSSPGFLDPSVLFRVNDDPFFLPPDHAYHLRIASTLRSGCEINYQWDNVATIHRLRRFLKAKRHTISRNKLRKIACDRLIEYLSSGNIEASYSDFGLYSGGTGGSKRAIDWRIIFTTIGKHETMIRPFGTKRARFGLNIGNDRLNIIVQKAIDQQAVPNNSVAIQLCELWDSDIVDFGEKINNLNKVVVKPMDSVDKDLSITQSIVNAVFKESNKVTDMVRDRNYTLLARSPNSRPRVCWGEKHLKAQRPYLRFIYGGDKLDIPDEELSDYLRVPVSRIKSDRKFLKQSLAHIDHPDIFANTVFPLWGLQEAIRDDTPIEIPT